MEAKIITVEDARQRLGKRAEQITDKEMNNLLIFLRTLCSKTIDGVIENKYD